MKRLSQNLLSLFFTDIVRRILGFVSVAYLARVLGKEGFGLINLGLAVLAYGMVLSTAGFGVSGTKRIAQGESPALAGQIIGSRLVTTLIVFAAIVLVSLVGIHDSTTAWLIILFSGSLFPQTFFVDWYFQGKERMGIVSVGRIVSATVYLAAIVLCIRTLNDVMYAPIGAFLGDTIAATWLFSVFRKANPSLRLRIAPSYHLLKQSLPLAVGVVFATLMINYPALALGLIQTTTEIGIYSAATKLVFFLLIGDRILSSLLLPASARLQTKSIDALTAVLQDALRWIPLVCLPIAAGGTLLGKKLIVLVFGFEYEESAVVFCVFIWYFFFTMLHTVYTSGLISAGREKAYGQNMSITAIAYVVCVTLGVIWYGAVGAALGVVLAEGFSLILMHRSLTKVVSLHSPKGIMRVLISTMLMAMCVLFLRDGNLWLAIFIGILSYGLLLFVLHALNINEVKSFLVRF